MTTTHSLYGEIAPDTAVAFSKVEPAAPLRVDISSEGGDWTGGIAAFNVLASRKAVTTHIMGIAAGAAALVFMAGAKRIMPRNTMLVLQDPAGFAVGEGEDIIAMGEAMIALRLDIAELYANRAKCSTTDILSMMSRETWLGAEAALEAGFATEIVEPLKMVAQFDPSRFRNVPKASLTPKTPEDRWAALHAKAWSRWNKPRIVAGSSGHG